MVIKRGAEWGSACQRPDGLVAAHSDAELGRLVASDPSATFTVRDGDIFQALGAPKLRDVGQRVPMDALSLSIDGIDYLAVAHVVARRPRWRGQIWAAMNVSGYGSWNVAPRAHPNDGRVDVLAASNLPLRTRWAARQRLALGTHVPHPEIHQSAVAATGTKFERPIPVYVDGEPAGMAVSIEISVLADHYHLWL